MADIARWMSPAVRERCASLADIFVVALAISLPWSTSAANILAWLWLVAAIPTFDLARLRRVLLTPAGGLPVLLVALALIGTLWAIGLPISERFAGLRAFHKLLFIPAFILYFQRSEIGPWVMKGFLLSCFMMLVLSSTEILFPSLPLPMKGGPGILVKDYVAQSAEFAVCAFLLAAVALQAWQEQRRALAFVLALVALAFLANNFEVTTSRTALVVLPVLILLFAGKQLSWKGALGLLATAVIFGTIIWSVTPELRSSVIGMWHEVRQYQPAGERTRAGERLEFWKKSIEFIADAPFIGHGTGSIADQFRKAAGPSGMAALASTNPHNQTFAVAIQLGLLGTIVLFAMWIAHLLLFIRGEGLAAWAGLVIVTQNIIGSLFNSHLFDFLHGWGYVIGVGVAAGMVFKNESKPSG